MIIFIPDTYNKAGLGHLYRCYKYAHYLKNKDIIFLIKKTFNKKFLNNSFKHLFYSNLDTILKKITKKEEVQFIFLDSYNKKLHLKNFNVYSKKTLSILDYKTTSKADVLIDHTFLRNKTYHNKNRPNQKILFGHNYFPICKNLKKLKKKIILIDFGSVKNLKIIKNSINFIIKMKLEKKYKVIVINKFITHKDTKKFKNIYFVKFIKNIKNIYSQTFFSIGACGISLYEKCFYNIPTIALKVSDNQKFNFLNFKKTNNILNYNHIINSQKHSKTKVLDMIIKVKKNLKKNFVLSVNRKKLNRLFMSIN